MPREGSLRHRIIAAYALLALAVCGLFALVVFFTVKEIETHLVERELAAIAKWQLARRGQGVAPELPPGVNFFSGAAIPADMRDLPLGFQDLNEDKRTLHVLSGILNGERFVVAEEIGEFKKIEHEVLLALGLGILASAVLALLLGKLTAGRVIAPVTALAQAVEHDALEAGAPSLMLDDEIGVLARTFAARTAELQQFLVRERLFTGDVSHELRTPLAVILGAAEVLAAQVGSRPELMAAVERIQRTALDSADRVGALLLLSRSPEALDAPKLELLPLIEREIERCRPLLAGKPVALGLQVHEEAWVFARPELAGMAIGNLLRNACHYTVQGEITVFLKPGTLAIEDTGPGLPHTVRNQLFERFVRGGNDDSGAGLGLAIVKRICEHLGWDIRLEDPASGGSRFVLTFPGYPITARSPLTPFLSIASVTPLASKSSKDCAETLSPSAN